MNPAYSHDSNPQGAGRRTQACIGLGSNLEQPSAQIARAFTALGRLPGTRLLARSSLYRSRPLGDLDQPDYLNAVAVLETELDAHALLDALQAIEAAHGRIRNAGRWAARTLDLDLLVFGDERHDDARLTVPHPAMAERDFVLYPLFEIAPGLEIPGIGPLRACLAACPLRGIERVAARGTGT